MTSRKFPWKNKPTQHDDSTMDAALSSRLFLVHELGPTQFLIKGEDSPTKFKVTIGEEQSCSGCSKRGGGSSTGGATPELCVHIFFVLLKVLRLDRSDPLSWQASLLDTEVDSILARRHRRAAERAARRRAAASGLGQQPQAAAGSASASAATQQPDSKAGGSGPVPPRELDSDDVCPICQDELLASDTGAASMPLVHCAWSCGAQLHAKCMRVWAEHQVASNLAGSGKRLSCPMCRAAWAGPDEERASSNEVVLRELRVREHAPVPKPKEEEGEEGDEKEGEDKRSNALVPHRGLRSAGSSSRSRGITQCRSCRAILPIADGRFLRCVHCADNYDVCRVCFLRSKGVGIGGAGMSAAQLTERANHVHCFVEARPRETNLYGNAEEKSHSVTAAPVFPYAYGVDWMPAPTKAPSLSASLAATLQSRELTQADYDLLLSLDDNIRNGGRPMMNQFLVRSLPTPAIRVRFKQRSMHASSSAAASVVRAHIFSLCLDSSVSPSQTSSPCCLCDGSILSTHPQRILPCFHPAHEACLQSQLSYDLLLRCPQDQMPVFPGLQFCEARERMRKKKKEEQAGADASAAVQPTPGMQLGRLALQGMGVGGGSTSGSLSVAAGRSLVAEQNDDDALDSASSSPAAVSATSFAPSHSHHFQLGTSSSLPAGAAQAMREQRAAATYVPGRLRTGGTAAFAPPSTQQREHTSLQSALFAAPLQLSASGSSFGPFSHDSSTIEPNSAPPVPMSGSSTALALRRARAIDDRLSSISASPPVASSIHVPDVSSLTVSSASLASEVSSDLRTPARSPPPSASRISKSGRPRASPTASSSPHATCSPPLDSSTPDLSFTSTSLWPSSSGYSAERPAAPQQRLASRPPQRPSPSPSPPRHSPEASDFSSLSVGRGSSAPPRESPSAAHARPRVGRAALSSSASAAFPAPSPAASLELASSPSATGMVGSRGTRASSASAASSLHHRVHRARGAAHREHVETQSAEANPDLSVGSGSATAAPPRANSSVAAASTRVRRGAPERSPAPPLSALLSGEAGPELAPSVSSLLQSADAVTSNNPSANPRPGMRSASQARRATMPSGSLGSSSAPSSQPASSMQLQGASFGGASIDGRSSDPSRDRTEGKLRRGRTAMATSSTHAPGF